MVRAELMVDAESMSNGRKKRQRLEIGLEAYKSHYMLIIYDGTQRM
jgi:hypothetical protein